jgi:hypothetical protein
VQYKLCSAHVHAKPCPGWEVFVHKRLGSFRAYMVPLFTHYSHLLRSCAVHCIWQMLSVLVDMVPHHVP